MEGEARGSGGPRGGGGGVGVRAREGGDREGSERADGSG